MIPPGARVWIAMGHTDMRKGMQGLALFVQQALGRDPFGGDLFVFRGRAGSRPSSGETVNSPFDSRRQIPASSEL